MTDLHDGFTAWLAGGSRDELPRDIALHASGCDACMIRVAAFDALGLVDPGMASPPPVRAGVRGRSSAPKGWMRAVAGAAAVAVVVVAGVLAGGNLIGPRPDGDLTAEASATPAEGVLGGVGGPSRTPTQEPVPSLSGTAAPSAEASGSPTPQPPIIAGGPTPNPTMGGGPPPISTLRPTPTPRPQTPAPTASAASSAVPTPVPTAVPTPVPTPEPTAVPTPVPDDCADGIDNDGDAFIDGLDPGCVLDGNEPSA